jgi:hypothetical protein
MGGEQVKTHIRDIRLFNNAGVSLPVCKANAKLLDTECRAPIAAHPDQATCAHCRRLYPKRYPWARKVNPILIGAAPDPERE